jgi:tRNA threonylcarbamoyladenosine biosynthesis protein TsaE
VFETDGPAATEAVGAQLAQLLAPGDIVHVCGELGAGKTTLVRGAARALGVTGPVTSPTFAIAHRYSGAGVIVAHLDLYRLGGLAGEDPELLSDYLGEDRITFVEWPPQRGGELGGPPKLLIELAHLDGDRRRVVVTA